MTADMTSTIDVMAIRLGSDTSPGAVSGVQSVMLDSKEVSRRLNSKQDDHPHQILFGLSTPEISSAENRRGPSATHDS